MNEPNQEKLIADLLAEGVGPQNAARLAREAPDVCRRQLEYLDYQDDQSDRAATLLASIEGDWPEPARSYWANATRRATEEPEPEPEPEPEQVLPDDFDTYPTASQPAPSEPDEDVRNLLAALESIAVMSHAHRGASDEECPVCVAWEALKQWAHQRAVRGR